MTPLTKKLRRLMRYSPNGLAVMLLKNQKCGSRFTGQHQVLPPWCASAPDCDHTPPATRYCRRPGGVGVAFGHPKWKSPYCRRPGGGSGHSEPASPVLTCETGDPHTRLRRLCGPTPTRRYWAPTAQDPQTAAHLPSRRRRQPRPHAQRGSLRSVVRRWCDLGILGPPHTATAPDRGGNRQADNAL